jgi:CBS-domain-containing membrane protein
MKTKRESKRAPQLRAATAVELMTTEPVTIAKDATLTEAVQLLVDRHISAMPVVDDCGRVVGVISRSDVVEHDREAVRHARQAPEYFTHSDLSRAAGEDMPKGFGVEQVDRTRVRDVMTPTVFAVRPETPVEEVLRQLASRDMHRLFVIDADGILVGVISTMDVVRNLLP